MKYRALLKSELGMIDLVLVGLIVVVVATGSYYLYLRYQNSRPVASPQTVTKPAVTY